MRAPLPPAPGWIRKPPTFVGLFACLGFAACATPEVTPVAPASAPASQPSSTPASRPSTFAPARTHTASISANALRRHVFSLASDEMEGRGAATGGIQAAAEAIEAELRTMKVAPAFGDRFKQPFEMLVSTQVDKASTLIQAGSKPFGLGKDFRPLPFSTNARVEGELVFMGYGITSAEASYDDYAGVEAKDRILVVLSGEPGEDDDKSPFEGRRTTPHSSVRQKTLLAREAGARAILIVKEKIEPSSRRGDAEGDAGIVAALITPEAAKRLLGFDVNAERKKIDASYAPKSRGVDRPPAELRAEIVRTRRTVYNVAAVVMPPGLETEEAVVIGAHYDHLGYGGVDSLSATSEPLVHNGADDNASGTAVVLEVARAVAEDPKGLKRRVYFVWFAGEESGLLGSHAFVKSPPVPMKEVAAMVNLDMVGHLRDQRLHLMGVKTGVELESLARQVVQAHGLNGTYGGDGYGPSDHTSFYAEGVPVLFLFTGAHSHYHKPSDDPDTLFYPGMAKVAGVAADLVRALAESEARVTYVTAPPPKIIGGGGYGPYFGSIPDFGNDVEGVRLSGVREGSPADKAGVQKDDVIVSFGGLGVRNLEDLTVALRRHAPGDVVKVEVLRDGKKLMKEATLQKRE